jgi:apolipoprotein N-acyltransferase
MENFMQSIAGVNYFYENKKLKKFSNLLIACLSGLLLFAAWPVSPFTFFIFIAFVPLLWLETKVVSRKKFFGLVYICMFIWNVATTWWIWNASAQGAVAAFLPIVSSCVFPGWVIKL